MIFSKLLLNLLLFTNVSNPLVAASTSYLENNNQNLAIKSAPNSLDELRQTDYKDIAQLSAFNMSDAKYNIVTPVKNQGMTNLCWAYTLASASEINMLLKQGTLPDDYNGSNFSLNEEQINQFVNVRTAAQDKLGLTTQDTFNYSTVVGGTRMFLDSQIFYQQNSPIISLSPNNLASNEIAAWPVETIGLDKNIQKMKEAIAQYGSLMFCYNSKKGMHPAEYHVTNTNGNIDHAAVIVGWDDNHKIKESPTSGAWLVKNSWGTKQLNKGYFWLSYDSDYEDITAINFVNKNTYQNIYYYDGMAQNNYPSQAIGWEQAVIFPVKKANKTTDEFLKAINITGEGSGSIDVKIYQNVSANANNRDDKINNPEDGELVHTETFQIKNTGYLGDTYTFNLSQEIKLNPNSFYSIVVKPNNFNLAISEEKSTNDLTFKKIDGKWTNLFDNRPNVWERFVSRIKALTIEKPAQNSTNDLSFSELKTNQLNYGNLNKLEIECDNVKLSPETDYELKTNFIEETNGNNIGKYIVTIKGKGRYTGTKKFVVNVTKGTKPEINFGSYNDNKIEMSFNVNLDNMKDTTQNISLPDGWEFKQDIKLNFGDNLVTLIYVGHDAKYYQMNEFVGNIKLIAQQTDINNQDIKISVVNPTYSGKPIEPSIQVVYKNKVLDTSNYKIIKYENNTNVNDKSELTILGTKYLNGQIVVPFKIQKDKNVVTASVNNNQVVAQSKYDNESLIIKYYKDENKTQEILFDPNVTQKYYVHIKSSNSENWISDEKTVVFDYVKINNSNNLALIISMSTIIPIVVVSGFAGFFIYSKNKKSSKK